MTDDPIANFITAILLQRSRGAAAPRPADGSTGPASSLRFSDPYTWGTARQGSTGSGRPPYDFSPDGSRGRGGFNGMGRFVGDGASGEVFSPFGSEGRTPLYVPRPARR